MHDSQLEIIGALSNDLYRIAELSARGSDKAALRFAEEAQKRVLEVSPDQLPHYLQQRLVALSKAIQDFSTTASKYLAEDLLMHSILLSNYCAIQLRKNYD